MVSKEKLKEMYEKYARSKGFMLNPDEKILDMLLESLIQREKKYGYRYCPCRVISGDPEKDKKIICPCVYHLEEIKRMGRCWCGIFVKPGVKFNKAVSEDEMKEWKEIWKSIDEKLKK